MLKNIPKTTILKVNSPRVVHETIDGETIIMDMKTGHYYSLEWPGTFIWEYLAEGAQPLSLFEKFLEKGLSKKEKFSEVESFIKHLMDENLLSEIQENEVEINEVSGTLNNNIEKLVQNFKAPVVNKYTDMQEMLLLDPIHDVDEKGWPEPKVNKE